MANIPQNTEVFVCLVALMFSFGGVLCAVCVLVGAAMVAYLR